MARGGVAERNASATYLAQNSRGAGNFGDVSGFAETHLPNALAKIHVPGEPANAAG